MIETLGIVCDSGGEPGLVRPHGHQARLRQAGSTRAVCDPCAEKPQREEVSCPHAIGSCLGPARTGG